MSRLAFAFVLLVGCGARVPAEERGNCEAYLDCLAQTDPDTFEDELAVYGNDGSCFDGASREDCETACLSKLEALGETDEACEPPPQPQPDPGEVPPVDADGYVDCAAISSGPTVGPGEPGPTGFPEPACNPRSSGEGEWKCCSDDPAAFGGGLPDYEGLVSGQTPIFSGRNNALGTSGMCVRTGDLPSGSGLREPAAAGCPTPCNPTWGEDDVATVCGASRVCCQTRLLQPEDCVQDEDGTWRPATGQDILDGSTNWAPAAHATHQDPGGQGCATFAGTTDVGSPDFSGCLEQLSVADQRGYCMALGPGQACPGAGEPNACDLINAGEIPPPG